MSNILTPHWLNCKSWSISRNLVETATALMKDTNKNRPYRNKKRNPAYCSPGSHNPLASHDESSCWNLHPELRPNHKGPSTQLVEKLIKTTHACNLRISTGGHHNFLQSTAVGYAVLLLSATILLNSHVPTFLTCNSPTRFPLISPWLVHPIGTPDLVTRVLNIKRNWCPLIHQPTVNVRYVHCAR
ncbi:hypothetical protein VP01_544g8 [Puccinia sorghi]|uniref:Uncharacterized protein n=1 Tax=Puccinia sorghi TaxID=27349 RepID=A0A0L6ULN1_9BASI|nr:hypothetical protein VP01_544g8 [Puccinia sorghi]